MRVWSRVALVFIAVVSLSTAAVADHQQGDCPLTLVGSVAGGTDFGLSPHGVFRSNGNVYVVRGQTLSTYTVNAAGELTLQRDDFISTLAGREPNGAVLIHNGFLYVSTNAGLEVFALSNLRTPAAVLRNVHYRRLAASGTTLAGLYPGTDYPCSPNGTSFCSNFVDVLFIGDPTNPFVASRINSQDISALGFNDIAFNYGYLFVAGEAQTLGFSVANVSAPQTINAVASGRATFLVSNGTNLLGIGNDGSIDMYNVSTAGGTGRFAIYNLSRETIDRANPIAYHPQAFIDDQAGRLITMIDEIDPQTLKPARTIAFDVFDFSVPMWEGAYERGYENISYISPDEVKHNPFAVGSQVLVIGERSGLQAYGACGVAAGRFEFDGLQSLNCFVGNSLHGWVTGPQKIVNVEIFLDNTSLGSATLSGPPRKDIPSRDPVQTWRLDVDLDATAAGVRTLRAVATDAFGTRRQFATQSVLFKGPGQNCTNRRRSTGR